MTSSTMFLHVGQCGNQVALPLWSLAAAERRIAAPDAFTSSSHGINNHTSSSTSGTHPLFDPSSGHARAVFVDSEPKAIGETLKGLPAGTWNKVHMPCTMRAYIIVKFLLAYLLSMNYLASFAKKAILQARSIHMTNEKREQRYSVFLIHIASLF